ncbi:MAG: hypothetical protein U5K70_09695 [Halodesulfurarchaeum sp.]|nr:hypothetical protein [Halodesulfurarchaeum sp.]
MKSERPPESESTEHRSPSWWDDRGQSTLDFLLGTVIFLFAVLIVVAVVPGMLDPFATGSEAHPVAADRAVTTLATEDLADGSPYIATESRVKGVFNQTESELGHSLGIPDRARFNVTLRLAHETVGTVGPEPPSSGSVTSAWRVVSYEGAPANLTVRMW